MENQGYSQIVGSGRAPYINNTLIPQSALLTNYFAITHPSLPNYLALYSGSTHGDTSDGCPQSFSGPTLNSELAFAGYTFHGYSEDIPSNGSTACSGGPTDSDGDPEYQGHHDPWIYFGEASVGLGYSGVPSAGFPAVSFIVPNLCDDMHDDCSGDNIAHGDSWLAINLPSIISWNASHNGLLVVVWDESTDSDATYQVPAILVGPMVKTGQYGSTYTHYSLVRLITNTFGLPALNGAAPLSGMFN